ncbi:hypothetical protein BsWGS_05858 [Bradybaena similaris]
MNSAVFFLLVVIATTYSESTPEADDVLNLTTANFEDAIKENEFVLVEFLTPGCWHCQKLNPAYSQAATQLKSEGSAIKLATVDAETEAELATKFEISGYPTLKFFISGSPIEYTGGLESEDIITWLKKKTGPPAQQLKDKSAIAAFKKEDKVVVIGFFKDQESDKAKEYLKVARTFDNTLFGITSDKDSFVDANVQGDSIVLFKQFDEGRNDFEGEFNATNIRDFVFLHRLPLVVEFNGNTVQKIFDDGPVKRQVVLFSKKADSAALIEEVSQVAKDFRGQFIFVYVDTEVSNNEYVLEYFGLKKDTGPAVRLFLYNDTVIKYQPKSDGVDDKTVRQFLQDHLDGRLEPFYVSEDVPEDWDSKPVKVLVGKNFKEVVPNKDKAVFVKFYASWSGHCRALKPVWDALGEAYKDSDKIIIARMDKTLNEIPGVEVPGYPTLKFFPRGSHQGINYEGERTLEAFKAFLDSEGKVVDKEKREGTEDDDEAEQKEEGGENKVQESEGKEAQAEKKVNEDEAREQEDEGEEKAKEEAKVVSEKEDKEPQEEEKETLEDEKEVQEDEKEVQQEEKEVKEEEEAKEEEDEVKEEEKEVKEEEKEVQEDEKEVQEDEKEVQDDEKEVQEDEKDILQEEKEVKEDEKEVPQEEKEVKEEEEEVKEEEEEVKKEEEEIKEEEEEVKKEEVEVKEEEEEVKEEEKEVQDDEKEVKKEEKEVKEEEEEVQQEDKEVKEEEKEVQEDEKEVKEEEKEAREDENEDEEVQKEEDEEGEQKNKPDRAKVEL